MVNLPKCIYERSVHCYDVPWKDTVLITVNVSFHLCYLGPGPGPCICLAHTYCLRTKTIFYRFQRFKSRTFCPSWIHTCFKWSTEEILQWNNIYDLVMHLNKSYFWHIIHTPTQQSCMRIDLDAYQVGHESFAAISEYQLYQFCFT